VRTKVNSLAFAHDAFSVNGFRNRQLNRRHGWRNGAATLALPMPGFTANSTRIYNDFQIASYRNSGVFDEDVPISVLLRSLNAFGN
jgi:hypothetical protein